MKKRMIFRPAWSPRAKTWIHKRIEKISKKENFCSACERRKECIILKELKEIKDNDEINFLITRCGFYKSESYENFEELQNKIFFDEFHVCVNSVSEELRKTQCMCRSESCRKLNIKNSKRNCYTADRLSEICKKYGITTLVFQCPNWDDTKRKLKFRSTPL